MRRNIFQIIKNKKSPLKEIYRIQAMLYNKNGIYVGDKIFNVVGAGQHMSIIDYIDKYLFKKWSLREMCIDCNDLFQSLEIDDIPEDDNALTLNFILNYCECIANLLYLVENNPTEKVTLSDIFYATKENIQSFLSWYNYDLKEFPKRGKVLLVLKNALASSVAENAENEDISFLIFEYNHTNLKGDIVRKKEILLALGAEIEPLRAELKIMNQDLEDNVFFMLNNLDIRHNNRKKGDKNYKEKVAKMSKNKLENWYDRLYQLLLVAFSLLDYKTESLEIKKLKIEITN